MLQGGQLREYQIEGLQWMLSLYNNNLNGILADEMGLGKTIQTIALLAYLLENKGVVGPHIIIAPKAVLPNWAHELAHWAPTIPTVLYDGRAEERRLLREEYGGEGKFTVLVTHYDLIMRDKAFLKKIKWNYMIVDEGAQSYLLYCRVVFNPPWSRKSSRVTMAGLPSETVFALQRLGHW
jgi:SNF2 family DNA or RNA helicase